MYNHGTIIQHTICSGYVNLDILRDTTCCGYVNQFRGLDSYRLASIVWSMIDGSASYDITEAQNFVMPAMDVVVYVIFQPVG